jgi:hypothetical protein
LAASLVEPDFDDGPERVDHRDGPLFASLAFAPNVRTGAGHDVAAVETEDFGDA